MQKKWSGSWDIAPCIVTTKRLSDSATVVAETSDDARDSLLREALRREFGISAESTINFFKQFVRVSGIRRVLA